MECLFDITQCGTGIVVSSGDMMVFLWWSGWIRFWREVGSLVCHGWKREQHTEHRETEQKISQKFLRIEKHRKDYQVRTGIAEWVV